MAQPTPPYEAYPASLPAVTIEVRPGGHLLGYVDRNDSYFRWGGTGIWTKDGTPVSESFAANLEDDFTRGLEAAGI